MTYRSYGFLVGLAGMLLAPAQSPATPPRHPLNQKLAWKLFPPHSKVSDQREIYFRNLFAPPGMDRSGGGLIENSPRHRRLNAGGGLPGTPSAAGRTMMPRNKASGGESSLSDSVERVWRAVYGSGKAASEDYATSAVRDVNGNIVVAGISDSTGSGNDILIVRYSGTGTRQWTARYDGPAASDDRPVKVATDASGNIFVAGSSVGIGSGYDIITLKYSPGGILRWAKRYDGPAGGDDRAAVVAVDGAGSVVVTGTSFGTGTGTDFLTVKYDSAGTLKWTARFNGAANGDDRPVGIVLDPFGNAYVAGSTATVSTGKDFALIKYSPAGAMRWVSQYNGLSNGDDVPAALVMASPVLVCVTGYSQVSGTNNDFATVMIDSSGSRQWTAAYSGPDYGNDRASALAVDPSGNICVTGSSASTSTGYDYVTVKYTAAGAQSWAARYNAPAGGDDYPCGISIDPSGYIYVTGSTLDYTEVFFNETTVMYAPDGFRQWVSVYKGGVSNDSYATAIVGAGSGSVIVVGYSDLGQGAGYDFTTVLYNFTGAQQWEQRYDGPGNSNDVASAVSCGPSNSVYVAGYSRSTVTGYDIVTAKYDSAGVRQWIARYDGPSGGDDVSSALTVDPAGNAYVAGYSYDSSGTESEYVTLKYGPGGNQLWASRYGGLPESMNFAFAVAVARSGEVCVTGTSGDSSGAAFDYSTIRYGAGGAQQWIARYNGSGDGGDYASAVGVDTSGNVFVTGSTEHGTSETYDFATVKYNPAGVQQWAKVYDGPANDDENAVALCVDDSGNVYVTGSSTGSGTRYDYATLKYAPGGARRWVSRYDGPMSGDDIPSGIAVGADHTVVVTGSSAAWNSDIATVKLDVNGVLQWVNRFDGPAGGNDYASGIALDSEGYVVVAGSSGGTGSNVDFATILCSPTGVRLWSITEDEGSRGPDNASAVAVDSGRNPVVTGGTGFGLTGDASAGSEFATVKYRSLLPEFHAAPAMVIAGASTGCRVVDSLVITNRGNATLEIGSCVSDDPDFSVDLQGSAAGPGSSIIALVTFNPLSPGIHSGHLIVTHNAWSSPDTIPVSGDASDGGAVISLDVAYGTNWQLISLPVGVGCPFVLDHLFGYRNGYVRKDTMIPGAGYWKKLAQPTMTFTGYGTGADSIGVAAQWNMIGSISEAVPVSSVEAIGTTLLSPFFGYTAEGGYFVAETLVPGHAYWIKVSQAGTILIKP